jgi:predicted TIM-barrel fold metal-dependent hydrolase
MIVDVSTFIGPYPFRLIPGATAEELVRQLDRLRIDHAWVGHLAAPWHRDPRAANAELLRLVYPHAPRLVPVPTVHPGLPGWEADLTAAREAGAPAVRVYPGQQALDPAGAEMEALVMAAAERRTPIILTDRFEDSRQAHPLDVARPLPAAALRQLARLSPDARLLVTHAGRSVIEEVHFGLTPAEAATLLWEISWIWGPPEDDLAALLETVGDRRFTFGTGMPLRIGDGALAKLDLLDAPADRLARLTGGNLREWLEEPLHKSEGGSRRTRQ